MFFVHFFLPKPRFLIRIFRFNEVLAIVDSFPYIQFKILILNNIQTSSK